MDMTGERRIPAPRERVWSALNDPDTLKACIPGCEKLERTAENEFSATAAVKIGPISARFNGRVQLSDIEAPTSYTITGEGQGGVAGFAKGGAHVALADDAAGTLLTYDVKAQVGGKIAQLGARLIDASAKQMADQFFDRFSARVAADMAPAGAVAGAEPGDTMAIESPPPSQPTPPPAAISVFSMVPREPLGMPIVFWIGSVIFLFVLLLIFGNSL
ncbi:carbon monoxide dehydrogenase G protein [Acidisphaera rubrifaciens HS-AP3]|uniref:Carbon monoxide dehydrogenase G protein n=2 Tax=Acidisphaera TaxID=50714 RepID=A0A0D6P8J2_9PROT|nr:carbon monoxide dehydrogenase G protein [Acidisphaera rubrifaciens HS-AP3]